MNLPVDYTKLQPHERRAVREKYIEIQEGLCAECKAPLSGSAGDFAKGKHINKNLFPKDFFKWPVHLHHSHDTGLTIGAVHCECNAVLWQFYGE